MDTNNKKLNIVIIGGSAAGLSAATRVRRINESANITIIDELSYIGCHLSALPLYVSGIIEKKESLLSGIEEKIAGIYNIRILKKHKALEIDRQNKIVKIKNSSSQITSEIKYDKLILACGNKYDLPKLYNIKPINIFTLKNLEDAIDIREYIEKTSAKKITIIGANYYGLVTANNFIKKGFEVTIIEKNPTIINEFDTEFNFLIKNELGKNGISFFKKSSIKKLIKNDRNKISQIQLHDDKIIKTHMIIFFQDISPNIKLALKSSLDIGKTGRIKVNNQMQTIDPDIFAIGNIAETFNSITKSPGNIPLIGPTQIQARVAGTVAAGGMTSYTGIIGTKIIKFQNFTIGVTGLNPESAKKKGYTVFAVIIHTGSHERFFPISEQLHIKITVNEEDRKILGAQVCGNGDGIDKKLDTLATAIYSKLNVDDLSNIDLSYSPELSTSKNPVNILGTIASNKLDGFSNPSNMNDIYLDDELCILDVRNEKEYSKAHIEGSIWIPLNELRSRLDEVPKDKNIYIYSHVGLRGYIAERILIGNGFSDVFNIAGGLTSIKLAESMI